MFVGTALSVRLLVIAALSLFIINGPYVYMVVCVVYAYNLTIVDHKAIDYLIKSKHEPTSTRLVTLLDHLNRYTFDLKYLEGSKLKVSDALSHLYSEEKHKSSDVIPLNFLLHFTDYQLNKESDHLANKLYTHK